MEEADAAVNSTFPAVAVDALLTRFAWTVPFQSLLSQLEALALKSAGQ